MSSITPRGYEKKPQKYWDAMITQKNDVAEIKREPVPARPILFSEESFDTLQPEETIKSFCTFVRQAMSRYEDDKCRLSELENKMQDLLHFAEMAKPRDIQGGYKLYKEIAEVRKERRACKNEIDLLAPVYELFHGTKMLDQLSSVQGSCKQVKKTISNKGYSIRTDVLDEFIKA